mmetsp:Transcript_29822/g.41221  ORF Transcript_29822/g.41221 Transcript_29822/m.41221 type:complete len:220 (+) Transcript_29822:5205-5864(+)
MGGLRHHRDHTRDWGRELEGFWDDCRGDLPGIHRDLHALLRHRAQRGHRSLPVPPRPEDHPDAERAHDPDRVLCSEQAAGAPRLHLPGPAGRTADHDPQRSVSLAGGGRPGRHSRHADLALVCATQNWPAASPDCEYRSSRPRRGVHAFQDPLRPATHAGRRGGACRRGLEVRPLRQGFLRGDTGRVGENCGGGASSPGGRACGHCCRGDAISRAICPR